MSDVTYRGTYGDQSHTWDIDPGVTVETAEYGYVNVYSAQWNGSATFSLSDIAGTEVDTFTVYNVDSLVSARQAITYHLTYLSELLSEGVEWV